MQSALVRFPGYISADFKDAVFLVLRKALQGTATANFEFPLCTKGGCPLLVLLNATPRIDSTGRLVGVVGVGQDISEKKTAEFQLTRVAADLRKLVDTANAPIFGINTEGQVNEWNQKAAMITGYSKEEVIPLLQGFDEGETTVGHPPPLRAFRIMKNLGGGKGVPNPITPSHKPTPPPPRPPPFQFSKSTGWSQGQLLSVPRCTVGHCAFIGAVPSHFSPHRLFVLSPHASFTMRHSLMAKRFLFPHAPWAMESKEFSRAVLLFCYHYDKTGNAPPCAQRMPCPTNTSIRTVICWDLIN